MASSLDLIGHQKHLKLAKSSWLTFGRQIHVCKLAVERCSKRETRGDREQLYISNEFDLSAILAECQNLVRSKLPGSILNCIQVKSFDFYPDIQALA